MNVISDLFIRFSKMRYEIKGVVEYFKMISKNFNFRLISSINLRSSILNFLQRNHEISILK